MVKIIGPLASHHASGRISAPRIYSSSLRNRHDRVAPPAPPPPPPHDLQVTGTLNPDATGFYDEAGTYDGKPYHARTDNAFFIFWDAYYRQWIITIVLGYHPSYWYSISPNIESDYNPWGTYLGIATVSAP